MLKHYFGDRYENTERIQVICADLSKDLFGLSEEEYQSLMQKMSTVIHTAASVKHYGSYKYFYETNVQSTKRMIGFCKQAEAKLIHISTLSVSGTSFIDQPEQITEETIKYFTENNLYIGQNLDNVYTRSKFEAEMAVLNAKIEGLQANIMRVGNLTNRYSDGMFQKNHESNAFLQRVRAVLALGIFPDYLMEYYVEFTPIDETARAVMTLARHFNNTQTVFHIASSKLLKMKQLGKYFSELGFHLEVCTGTKFAVAMQKTTAQTGKEYIQEAFINDIDENNQLNYISSIHVENTFTVLYLKALGFEWGDIDLEYLRKYLEYFKRIGYLEEKNERETN